MPNMTLNINAKARDKMLKEPILVFSDAEVERKHRNTLETLVSYYENLLESIGGPEIWEILERLAKAENVLIERRRNENASNTKKEDVKRLRQIKKELEV